MGTNPYEYDIRNIPVRFYPDCLEHPFDRIRFAMRFITLLSVFFLASVLMAADPLADENSAALSSPSSATDAIEMLGKLPNPLVEKHLVDFFASASTEDAGKVLMHIAISAVRPARAVVIPVLGHRDPQVVERALRALSSIGKACKTGNPFSRYGQQSCGSVGISWSYFPVSTTPANCPGSWTCWIKRTSFLLRWWLRVR